MADPAGESVVRFFDWIFDRRLMLQFAGDWADRGWI